MCIVAHLHVWLVKHHTICSLGNVSRVVRSASFLIWMVLVLHASVLHAQPIPTTAPRASPPNIYWTSSAIQCVRTAPTHPSMFVRTAWPLARVAVQPPHAANVRKGHFCIMEDVSTHAQTRQS